MVFGDGLGLTLAMGRICLVCQIVFFGIELIQLKHLGLEYFMGWNIIDFSQFWLYIFYYYAKFGDAGEDIESFLPHI